MSSTGILDSLGIIGTTAKKIVAFWQKTDSARRRLFIVVGSCLLLAAAILAWLLNSTQYEVLYTNLSTSEAGEILQQLEDQKIDAKASGTDTILVPKDEVDSIRMELAAAGYPKNSTNLDILAQGSGFGLTEEDKTIYRRYQLQDDLQNAIKTFDSVTDARVSLNIPETSSFVIENQKQSASAAVLLTLKPGSALSAGNVQAIAKLIEKSVPGLQPEGISIIDSNMNVLNADSASDDLQATNQQEMEREVGERLKKQVLALLQPIFGVDQVLAEISVQLNFDQSTVDSVRFEPNAGSSTGIIASIDKIREASTQSPGTSGKAGTDSNGASTTTYPVTAVDDQVYEKNSEAIHYEINTIKEHLVKAQGTISRLSVSVVINDDGTAAANYTENVKKLIAAAVGVSADYITVEKMPFKGLATQGSTWTSYQKVQEKALQWQRTRFYLLLGAGLLLFLVLFVSLVRFARGKSGRREIALAAGKDEEILELMPSLRREPAEALAEATGPADADEAERQRTRVTMSMLTEQGADEKRIVASYFENNPELAASILRSWLAEEQG